MKDGARLAELISEHGSSPRSTRRAEQLLRLAVWRGLPGLCATLSMFACTSIPPGRAAVDTVEFEGVEKIDSAELAESLATRATPEFLGLFQGIIFDYQVFDIYVLQRDLERVERYYRARGFYKAHARAARIFYDGPKHVRVSVRVEEGAPTIIERLHVNGLGGVPDDVSSAVLEGMRTAGIAKGKRLDEQKLLDATTAMKRAMTDRGYAYASVQQSAKVDVPEDLALVRFDVEPGEPASFGEVTIRGLEGIPEEPVRRALAIEPGTPYSTEEIDAAKQAVLELGVFSAVEVNPQLGDPPPYPDRIPIEVVLDVSRHKSVSLGAGIELDALRSDVHLIAGWEHRNFLGGLRHFSVRLKPGVVLYPTRVPTFQAPTDFLPENNLRVQLSNPGFPEARTHTFIRGEYNIFPIIITPEVLEDVPILGAHEIKSAVGVDRTWGRLYASPSYNIQMHIPFTYKGTLDPALGNILISYLSLLGTLDFRDSKVQPHKGALLSAEVQGAGLGGDARDVRIEPEANLYVPLGEPLTLALRANLGLLFPFNYGDAVEGSVEGGAPPGVERSQWVLDSQLLYLRGFFSGGPNSNRGYPLRAVGPHGVVPFFTTARQAASCTPGDRSPECVLPLGGFTLWETSLELRYPISGPLSAATFCDASDVSSRQLTLTYNPHLSCGQGLRYATPVGPVRFDVGYRIPGVQLLSSEDRVEPDPGTILGLPIAVSLGIGEAF